MTRRGTVDGSRIATTAPTSGGVIVAGTRVKFFSTSTLEHKKKSIEAEINDWLSEQGKISIEHVAMAAVPGPPESGAVSFMTVTVWYKPTP
jgi:hypothetical protein